MTAIAEPYPTKTRLALLRAVAQSWVWRDPHNGETYDGGHSVTPGPKVTVRITELHAADWVSPVPGPHGAVRWHLTDAGRAVLNQHTPSKED